MAVAVEHQGQFQAYQSYNRGFFNICPSGPSGWHVVFSWAIKVPDVSVRMPPLYLFIPADSTEIVPEKRVVIDERGDVVSTGENLTSVKEVASGSNGKLLKLDVGGFGGANNTTTAYYGINFNTAAFDEGISSIGTRKFKVSYNPTVVTAGYFPGFGGARTPSANDNWDLAMITCDLDHLDGSSFDRTSLDPIPSKEISKGKLLWEGSAGQQLTIVGKTSGGLLYGVESVAEWMSINAFAAGLGAIYGVGIEPPSDVQKLENSKTDDSRVAKIEPKSGGLDVKRAARNRRRRGRRRKKSK
ncbi:hypothetical protein [Amycolatopsis sp. NPDC021455]|uniref:hypothetical protein n=1 Tax=Amycolatopsis sp. NPDC021455 TaxID=3154901 RepID=UPI0033F00A63